MSRVYNFSAGPAVLPEEVLKEAQEEMLDYRGCGMSVMEMSHRSKVFQNIIDEAEADLRDLMGIPSNYKVLFLQGGASLQFSMIPMNLMKNGVADYIVTGQWAKKAYAEAQKYGKANKIASSEDKTFSYIPDCSDLPISPDADYVYICENNTIYGTKYKKLPNTKGKTLVADVSSCFLSEPVNVSDYGIIYGGVQKNIGPAGMVISIVRDDLITDDVLPGTPTMMKFKTHADAGSLYNTPNCYCIYMCGKVFKWLKKMGGLEEMQRRNIEKAKILYDFLDQSKLFKGTVVPEDRSLMNVPFVTGDKELDAKLDALDAEKKALEDAKKEKEEAEKRQNILNEIADVQKEMNSLSQDDSLWAKKRLYELQKALEEKEFTATAGGGAVEVTVSGKKEVVKVKLAEEVVDPDDIEMLEDLIVAATNEAFRQAEEDSSQMMSQLTGGLGGLGGGFPF